MATTTFNLRATSTTPRDVRRPPSCAKLDGVAMWLINGLTGAFFASLERCSCIRISTYEDDIGDEDKNLPLIFNDGNIRGDDHNGNLRRRRKGKGKKARAFDEY
ncbi:hypothetical protein ACJIZ3_013578 [Penstemon smallii]|uniref:Uncharacterized protein n=1 Tax=Penstemon smallii TaxID=265156 RepID=A0ABD3RU69_9LAMI